MKEFLIGYNITDGLKQNPCVYEFKNFKTNSATLAQGLIYLISRTTKQDINITIEESNQWEYKTFYYSINLLSNSAHGQNHNNSPRKAKKINLQAHELWRASAVGMIISSCPSSIRNALRFKDWSSAMKLLEK